MEGFSSDIVGIIYQLLPGFLVAWILYGLTAYLKPSSFERIVQALIFTIVVRATVIVLHNAALIAGKYVSIGPWTKDSELVASLVIAVFLGLLFAWCVNNDFPLYICRKDEKDNCGRLLKAVQKRIARLNLTNKTLHPSEWYTAFNDETRYVVLHLSGERRLWGWPRQFPDDPNSGYFLIDQPAWLLDSGDKVPLHSVHQFLVAVKEVERVEFLKTASEVEASQEELTEATTKLTDLYKKQEVKSVD